MRLLAVAVLSVALHTACAPPSFADLGNFTAVLAQVDPHYDASTLELRYDSEERGCVEFGSNLQGRVDGQEVELAKAGPDTYVGTDLEWHTNCALPRIGFTHPEFLGTPVQLELTDGTSTVKVKVRGLGSKLAVEPPSSEASLSAGGTVTLQLGAGWEHVTSYDSLLAINEGEQRAWNVDAPQLSGDGKLTLQLPPEIVPGKVTLQGRILPTTATLAACEGATCAVDAAPLTGLETEITVVP